MHLRKPTHVPAMLVQALLLTTTHPTFLTANHFSQNRENIISRSHLNEISLVSIRRFEKQSRFDVSADRSTQSLNLGWIK